MAAAMFLVKAGVVVLGVVVLGFLALWAIAFTVAFGLGLTMPDEYEDSF